MADVISGTQLPKDETLRALGGVAAPSASSGTTAIQDAARRPETGVATGGAGYVSGQVAPTGSATTALGAVPPPGGSQTTLPTQVGGATIPAGGWRPQFAAAPPADSWRNPAASGAGTETITSALATPAPTAAPAPTSGGWRTGAAPDTTTVQSALGISSPAANGATGTSNPNTGTYNNPALVSTGNAGVDRILDPGGIFTGATMTDTGPAVAAQKAAFGISDDLNQERYDYRPGAAAAQDRVSLDKTQADQTRGGQVDALGRLRDAATGAVPSAAELQMRREAGKNVAATLGQARALGGRSAGGAARAGTLATADILANNTAQGAQLRAAEQERARAAEMAALGTVRGQDVDTANADARLAQEANANNLRSQLEQNDLAEKHRLTLLDEQLKALGIGTGAAGSILNAGAANANADNKQKGGILSAVGDAF